MPIKNKPLSQPWNTKRVTQGRRKHDNSKFYQSRRWRTHRKIYLSKHPLCVHCQADNKVTAAKVLDHITPINQGGAKFDYNNLQGLCSSCHNKKSGREAHLNHDG